MTDRRFSRPTRRQVLRGSILGALGLAGAALIGCGDDDDDEGATAAVPAAEAPAVGPWEILVLSSSSPNVTVIDSSSNEIVRTADIEGFSFWSWVDSNTFNDGEDLWFGFRDEETNEAEVVALNLDSLEITTRIPIGTETHFLYTGKLTADGRLFVAKHAARQMAVVDIRARTLIELIDVPIELGESEPKPTVAPGVFGGDVACDVDVAMGSDGVERVFYPTWDGDTVVSLDARTGEALRDIALPGTAPVMLSVAPDGTVWVQENGSHSNVILNPVTLDIITRVSTGNGPSDVSFSPDGALGYVGGADAAFTVIDVATRQVLREVTVGTNVGQVAPLPSGDFVYVAVSREGAVAVVDTSTWEVETRIDIGTDPNFILVRSVS